MAASHHQVEHPMGKEKKANVNKTTRTNRKKAKKIIQSKNNLKRKRKAMRIFVRKQTTHKNAITKENLSCSYRK